MMPFGGRLRSLPLSHLIAKHGNIASQDAASFHCLVLLRMYTNVLVLLEASYLELEGHLHGDILLIPSTPLSLVAAIVLP